MNKRTIFAVLMILLAVLIAAGIGMAQGDQTYTGCLDKGQIKNVAIGDTPLKPCKEGEDQISWNQTGVSEITRTEFDDLSTKVADLQVRVEELEGGSGLDPTSYWYLDEKGDLFEDHGSYGISAEDNETYKTEVITGVIDNGRECSSPDHEIRLSSNEQYRWETDDKWSVEFWFRLEPDFGNQTPLIRIQEQKFDGQAPEKPGEYLKNIWIAPRSDGNFSFGMDKVVIDGEQSSFQMWSIDVPMNDFQWHHWVIAYDGSKTDAGVKIFRDGILLNTITSNQHSTWPTAFNWTDDVYQQFCGGLKYSSFDEVVIYDDYVLTPAEVLFRYNGGVAHRGM